MNEGLKKWLREGMKGDERGEGREGEKDQCTVGMGICRSDFEGEVEGRRQGQG